MKLEISKGAFRYAKGMKPVLQDINLDLRGPCFTGILGPNGTGKSTLLKCINRIYDWESGSVQLDGIDMGKMPIRDVARKIAYVPQSTTVQFPVSVMDTVLMGRIPYSGHSFSRKDREKAERALQETGLSQYSLRDIRFLSGGERQRVFIARAIAGDPELILLDEPTSSLDVRHQLDVMRLLRNLVQCSNLSVLMTIHDLNLAAMFCERILILKGGRIWKNGTPQEVLTKENIREIYHVNVEIVKEENLYIHLLDV